METNSEPPRAWLMGRRKWPAINFQLVGLFCEHYSPSLRRCVSPCLKLRLKMTAFQRITNKFQQMFFLFVFSKKLLQTHLRYLNLSVFEMGGPGEGGFLLSVHHKYGIYTQLYFQFLMASTHNTAKNSACSHKTISSKRCCKQGQPWLFIMRRFDSLVKLSSSQEKQFRIFDKKINI